MVDKLEEDFEVVKVRIQEKIKLATQLLAEANALAGAAGYSLHTVDTYAMSDLQSLMEDCGLVIEKEAWSGSEVCW